MHGVAGVFGGRLVQDGNPDSDLAGARLGVGIGELLQVNAFHWRGINADEREFTASSAWGAETRFALNAGVGVAPFLLGGITWIDREETGTETAAIAGAGLMIPLGPVLIEAAVQDYILGISALNGSEEAMEATHNWLYSAGVSLAIGPRRRSAVTSTGVPPPAAPPARPTVVEQVGTEPMTDDLQRNYHSDRSIQIPIPVEGSILLRYGPDPVQAAGSAGLEPLPGARSDADLELMLRRIVADEVTSRLSTSPMILAPGGTDVAGGAALSDARVQQIVDRTVAALLPRLEASQSQQMNSLRAELTAALNQQTELIRSGVPAQLPLQVGPLASPAGVEPAPLTPPAALPPTASAVPRARMPPGGVISPPPVPAESSRELRLAGLRSRIAELTVQHSALGAVETSRGPGLSLPGTLFAENLALPGGAAADLIGPVARLANELPDVLIYVHGHAAPGTSEVSAQALSELRAEAIRSLLVQAGVEPARVHAIGYGAAQPLNTGTRPGTRALNRRVEIVFGL